MARSLHQNYADSMTYHGYGHGFYEPESTKDVRSGLCGYIDDTGRWQTIIDLTKPADILKDGYTAIGAVDRMATTKRRWGPKSSSSVSRDETSLDATASGAATGFPIDASILWTYSHSSDFGAIVLCPTDVVNEGYRQKAPFRAWALQNAKALLRKYPDVKGNGLFIITSTWSTKDVFTTAWTNPKNRVKIGVKVGATGIAGAGTSKEYYREHSAGSWIEADTKVCYSLRHFNQRMC